ncbi:MULTISPECIES: MurR/RpiR family transcriptional regulator [Yersinia]|uniref:SIS domain-containing protein n=2 Tax=Yersinia intermedia TaxID=631 RepID=A0ABX6F6W4_YERIN|nr:MULTISPECIES: MurR/RpiR family transcriptional regulator [Yersinia]ARB86420.2 MurR/RpiR family transcriptional regulator [Yersinia sp. FDAARGOS_228]AVL38335.1 MurR/RpiR family transcriptional regulator [Yersinia intermedia]MCB5300330.1 MurR/RpiR family transcriptional regulator [Yersinia intermedia]MCW8113688.1 MurR/RpiR family transcriptional regulator [Yersinia intermedia]MDA5482739.1 MurR/RpiR family transcriptional regulator [Yersinia intermedia]
MMNTGNLLLRLRQDLAGYSPTLQKLGNFVIEESSRVIYFTITELARESGTSEASVTRLCRHLGCKGYTEFKMILALCVQQSQPEIASNLSTTENLVEESVQALRDTGALLDHQALQQAAQALHQAETVQIYGVAASAIIGDFLQYKLLRVGKPALLFSDMHRAAMNASSLGLNDMLIAISSSGSTKDILHAVTLAKQRQARVIVISNTQRSPLAKLADTLLVAAKPEGPLNAGTLPAKVGAMLLVEFIVAELTKRDPAYSQSIQDTASATFPLLL